MPSKYGFSTEEDIAAEKKQHNQIVDDIFQKIDFLVRDICTDYMKTNNYPPEKILVDQLLSVKYERKSREHSVYVEAHDAYTGSYGDGEHESYGPISTHFPAEWKTEIEEYIEFIGIIVESYNSSNDSGISHIWNFYCKETLNYSNEVKNRNITEVEADISIKLGLGGVVDNGIIKYVPKIAIKMSDKPNPWVKKLWERVSSLRLTLSKDTGIDCEFL